MVSRAVTVLSFVGLLSFFDCPNAVKVNPDISIPSNSFGRVMVICILYFKDGQIYLIALDCRIFFSTKYTFVVLSAVVGAFGN